MTTCDAFVGAGETGGSCAGGRHEGCPTFSIFYLVCFEKLDRVHCKCDDTFNTVSIQESKGHGNRAQYIDPRVESAAFIQNTRYDSLARETLIKRTKDGTRKSKRIFCHAIIRPQRQLLSAKRCG